MPPTRLFKPRVAELLFGVLVLGAATFIYAGFLYPDPVFLKRLGPGRVFLASWLPRLLIPLLVAIVFLCYIRVRQARWSLAEVGLGITAALVALLILYPLADYMTHRSFFRNTEAFHPYLQLMPAVPVSMPPDSSVVTIFCLGGSTTEFTDTRGRGWPDRVEKVLRSSTAEEVEIYNLGKGWYTSLHTLYHYQTNLRQLEPDIVVVMHAINDLLPNADFSYFSTGAFREDYGHFIAPLYRVYAHEAVAPSLWRNVRAMWFHQPRKTVEVYEWPGLKAFERNLRQLIEMCRRDGTGVVLMTQPTLYKEEPTAEEQAALAMFNYESVGPREQWSLGSAVRGINAYNERIRSVARAEGVILIDLASEIAPSLENFYDDCHYRDPAFDRVASVVADGLRGLVSRKTGVRGDDPMGFPE